MKESSLKSPSSSSFGFSMHCCSHVQSMATRFKSCNDCTIGTS
jgi:hypothetical protein